MEGVFDHIQKTACERYPRKHDKIINYGTAGHRTQSDDLDHVLYRMGVLAVLRSKLKNATIGAMITASHNPEEDNGIKLVDPMGEMLEASWEKYATHLANIKDEVFSSEIREIVNKEKINLAASGNVYFARDTRPSSQRLAQALQCGVEAMGGSYKDFGLLTTPQLHFMVRCKNTDSKYGTATEEGYYQKLSSAFIVLSKRMPVRENSGYNPTVKVDAANGIGAVQTKMLQEYKLGLNIELHNDGSQGKLNYQCGADYVKTQQRAPAEEEKKKGKAGKSSVFHTTDTDGSMVGAKIPLGSLVYCMEIKNGCRYASYDGDADRIVYYYADTEGKFHLMDGDKIATLVAGFLQNLVRQTGLSLDLGLVQTAYANGSSTDYITQKLKVPVACVSTGVKHLHHRAQQFEVGVYFEANGHGTVLFSDCALDKIEAATVDSSLSDEQKAAASQLSAVVDLINQTVGDAISDMLLVETILAAKGWDISDWDQAYTDLPNRLIKVKVKDRTVIQTADAERKVVTPEGLQAAVDTLVSKYQHGRSFVRPSGTEDVVRVYAEADSQENADRLALEVGLRVYKLAGGVGDLPKPPQ